MKNFLYFLIGFALAFFTGLAFAALPPATPIFSRAPLPGYIPSVQGPFYVNPAAFPSSSAHVAPAPFDIVTSRGTISATIPVTVNANIPRLAASVGSFALKMLPYAGVAIALYDVICSTANYCADSTKPSGFAVQSAAPSGWTVDQDGFMHAPSSTAAIDLHPSTGQHRCHALYDSTVSPGGWQPDASALLPECRVVFNGNMYQGGGVNDRNAFAPVGYSWDGGAATTASKTGTVPNDNTPSGNRDSTDADRTALSSNSALNTASVVGKLAASGEPVPIDDPVVSPVSVDGQSSDVVNRDSAGNPTTTTRTQTTENITPAPLPGDPLRIQIQETTTTTTINNAGDIISSSTTTVNTPPETQEEKDSTVKFDDAVPLEIPKAEIPNEYSAQDWGSSASCPADPVLDIPGGFTITLPVHVACDAMTYMKPVVLLIASMAAGLIIMGAVKS